MVRGRPQVAMQHSGAMRFVRVTNFAEELNQGK